MADLKISQLTGATTPLAGTEVLPIVQSGSTRQVSVANLTAGRTQTSNGIVQGTAGTGYNFTANTPAAGMTSQLLNAYEEGTWTPTVSTSGSISNLSYTTQIGNYIKIGRLVYLFVDVSFSCSSSNGYAYINGLPFNSEGSSYNAFMVRSYSAYSITSGQLPAGWIAPGANYFNLQMIEQTNGSESTVGFRSNGGRVNGWLIYRASA